MNPFYENRLDKISMLPSRYIRPYPAHWHSAIEITQVERGTMRIEMESGSHVLKKGDICFINTGVVHANTYCSPDLLVTIRFIGRELLLDCWHFFCGVHLPSPVIRGGTVFCGTLEPLLIQLDDAAMGDGGRFNDFKMKSLAYFICLCVLEELEWSEYSRQQHQERERKAERLQIILDYIDEHYAEKITLESIAEEVNFGMYYFSRFFKKAVGLNFVSYLTAVRVRKAMMLLNTTDLPASEIAYEAGFGSVKTFYRAFKETCGVSPLEYRREESKKSGKNQKSKK